MRIIVTGAAGQLGVDLVKVLRTAGHEVFAYDRAEMDITDLCAVRARLLLIAPDAVVHSAAYTAVDRAETDVEQAFLVNAYGTRNIAVAAAEVNAKLVYLSTDYVFDGTAATARTEFDPVHPLSVYGRSKLAGEQFVQQFHTRYFIVRTAWVYGKHGSNFVYTMLRLGAERGGVQVVADQVGAPTYTVDLAETIARLLPTSQYGIYHVTGGGSCSWYEFAQAIFAAAASHAALDPARAPSPYASVTVTPCTTAEFPQAATRPAYSVLDAQALRLGGFPTMRHWRDALHAFFAEFT
jgi:dTDP-4-dehydrorhamnose reductase